MVKDLNEGRAASWDQPSQLSERRIVMSGRQHLFEPAANFVRYARTTSRLKLLVLHQHT